MIFNREFEVRINCYEKNVHYVYADLQNFFNLSVTRFLYFTFSNRITYRCIVNTFS